MTDEQIREWARVLDAKIFAEPTMPPQLTIESAARELLAMQREEDAKIAEKMWPRGSAHTYASENADRYIALEDASEYIAAAIRKGKP